MRIQIGRHELRHYETGVRSAARIRMRLLVVGHVNRIICKGVEEIRSLKIRESSLEGYYRPLTIIIILRRRAGGADGGYAAAGIVLVIRCIRRRGAGIYAVIAARIGRMGDIPAASQVIAARLLLGRMMQSGGSGGGGIEHGKPARMVHMIRGQLHGRAEMIVVQQTSRRQAAQRCAVNKYLISLFFSHTHTQATQVNLQGGGSRPEP